MRLIDADALIEAMKKTESEYENAMTCPSWWSAFNVISEQPTAYDIDKVVEELETNKQNALEVEESIKEYNVWNKAIEIVNHGGVSDDMCEWTLTDTRKVMPYKTSCGNEDLYDNSWKYCPHCSKKIKVVE